MIDFDVILTTFGIIFGIGICILGGYVLGIVLDYIDEKKNEKDCKKKND